METSWYYAHDRARKGPVSREDLRHALIRGEVNRLSLVWCEGMPHWQTLESIEELQQLLAHVPPSLAHQPPPLPPEAPAPPAGAAGDPPDSARHGDERAAAGPRQRPEKTEADQPGRVGKLAGWLAHKIGDTLWERLFGQPAVTFLLLSSLVVGVVYVANHLPPKAPPPEPAATGQVRIDANPWGQIEWIRGPGGSTVDLPEVRTTPFVMTLPVGSYQAQVDYPHAKASERCELRVETDQLATCWLDLAPVDAKSYLQKIGW